MQVSLHVLNLCWRLYVSLCVVHANLWFQINFFRLKFMRWLSSRMLGQESHHARENLSIQLPSGNTFFSAAKECIIHSLNCIEHKEACVEPVEKHEASVLLFNFYVHSVLVLLKMLVDFWLNENQIFDEEKYSFFNHLRRTYEGSMFNYDYWFKLMKEMINN